MAMKKHLVFMLLACGLIAVERGSAQQPTQSRTVAPAKVVSRTTKAVNYRQRGATKIAFRGTGLMGGAYGEAKVESKRGRAEIEATFAGLEDATKLGLEYLTYVL